MAAKLRDDQLLWIDLDTRDRPAIDAIAAAVGLDSSDTTRLARAPTRVDLTQYEDHIHVVLVAMETAAKGADTQDVATDTTLTSGDPTPASLPVDILAGRNWVLTVHDGPFAAIGRVDAGTEGETRLGALDAAGFVAAIVDEVLAGYFTIIERIEREIDELDEMALHGRPSDEFLVHIVALRRRIGVIRRTLAPHRTAFAAFARPEMDLHKELGRPWPGLTDRLERALDSVENLRDLLLGTFDIHMGRAAQDANDVMKVLTLLSAVLLPSVVLAGVMGMNFPLPFFDDPSHFWWVIAAMVAFAVGMFGLARWRHWL
jgi:Mg2+ and Co2+ transporter CorA